MIPIAAMSIPNTKVIPPAPRQAPVACRNNTAYAYCHNKTAWMVSKSGHILFEYRSSTPLSAIAVHKDQLIVVGDVRGFIRLFSMSSDQSLKDAKPVLEQQLLMTDIVKMAFAERSGSVLLAVGGGNQNTSCRQFIAIVQLVKEGLNGYEARAVSDGTGGPTKAVNDLSIGDNLIAFAADDRSVTVFKVSEGSKTLQKVEFVKSFTDFGGLVGRVSLSENGTWVVYGGTCGRFKSRQVASETASDLSLQATSFERVIIDNNGQVSTDSVPFQSGPAGVIKLVQEKNSRLEFYNHLGQDVFDLSTEGHSFVIGSLESTNSKYSAKIDGRRVSVSALSNEPVRTNWSSHDSSVTSVVWLDDSKLASVGLDGHLIMWSVDVPLKPIAATMHAHHGPVSHVIFDKSSKLLITTGQEDASIRFFSLQ